MSVTRPQHEPLPLDLQSSHDPANGGLETPRVKHPTNWLGRNLLHGVFQHGRGEPLNVC